MSEVIRQTQQASQGGATFAPEEFAEQRSWHSTRPVLSAIEKINNELIVAATQRELFTMIAQICSNTMDYPYVSILLFDNELKRLDVAGLNNPEINLLALRRGPNVIYRSSFSTEELRDLEWVRAVRDGKIYVTTAPYELFMPFASATRARYIVRKLGIAQGVMLPLFVRGNLIGALKVCSRSTEYAPGERSDMLTFATHIALTAEMWRSYDRAEARSAVLKRLHTISQTITGILDLNVLYQEITRAAGRFTRIDFCSVNLLSPDRKSYENHAAWGEGARSNILNGRQTFDNFPKAELESALAGETLLIPDLSRFPVVKDRFKHRYAGAAAVFPFKCEGKVVGFMTIGRDLSGVWDAETIEILQELTEYMTVAFTNAQRFAETQGQVEIQRALAESARLIARAETSQVLQRIAEAGSRLFMSAGFAVLLPDAAGNLVCAAAHGPDTENVLGFWVHKGEGLVGKVMENQMPVYTSDLQARVGLSGN
ncbi:MAG: GAF domain-containing protein, partial [Chloroflexia bacterium]